MTPEERAALAVTLMLRCGLDTTESMRRCIRLQIEGAILEERETCAKIAENHYRSFKGMQHQDLSGVEEAVGKNIAREIREQEEL